MQTATATTPGPRKARIALLSALGIASSIALTGCGLASDPSTLPAPAEQSPSASEGYLYEDAAAGFAITFPGEPVVAPIAGNEDGAQRATYTPKPPEGVPFYVAGGTTRPESEDEVVPDDFQIVIDRMIFTGFAFPTDDAEPTSIELDGLPALSADMTVHDGNDMTIVLAGEGRRFFQLMVIGGTPEERQEFFDSFELID